jgi:tRNA-specific 2-thiouridylase
LPSGKRALFRATDPERDQSYFLYGTTFAELDFLRFPLGDMSKAEVRALAREFGLPVADKHDSQDICFVPSGRYTDIVERLKPGAAAPGDIVDLDGRVLGKHPGVVHFTVGQRRGLGIPAREALYVVRLDAERRRVVVGPKSALETKRIVLADVNWLGDAPMEAAMPVHVRVRSTRAPQPALLHPSAAGAEIELIDGEEGVAPGQACVLYDSAEGRARVLGGGTIRAAAAPAREALLQAAV